MPTYIAIGDIHGTDDLLRRLLELLPDAGTLVFLGDYIDRGPASREVIERLIRLATARTCVFLRGNHEAMALEALAGNRLIEQQWLRNGGVETLESYGGRISPPHLAFLQRTLPLYATDVYVFVHGGVRPGCQPEAMAPEELWWMREPFLSSTYDWGRLVIHGHTPTGTGKPEIRPNRINIDTGAVYGGPLTAVLLPERDFVSVHRTP